MMVDKEGLNILSLKVSMNASGPENDYKKQLLILIYPKHGCMHVGKELVESKHMPSACTQTLTLSVTVLLTLTRTLILLFFFFLQLYFIELHIIHI